MKKKLNEEKLINQNIKIEELETSNRVLLEKLKLLKIQLESQSQLQVSTFHMQKFASFHRSQTNLYHRNYSGNGSIRHDESSKSTLEKQYESILQQLHMLQEELENVKKQYKNRISELEEQFKKSEEPISPTKLKTELNDNVELIKLKRLTKKQTAQIQSLQSQLEIANSEIKQLQSNQSVINSKNENLQTELSREKCETNKLQSNIETLKDNNKFLEEQLNDLQVEKNTLKEHNENLLKLSLQKESNMSNFDFRTNFLKQIEELEDNLKKEVVAKSEALAKLADSEILNIKLQTELSKTGANVTELKINNSTLKDQIKTLKDKLDNVHLRMNQRYNSPTTEDKAVMATITDSVDVVCSKNALEDLSNITETYNGNDTNIKMQLFKISSELNQCKELLRVQYGLNNKYKTEIEELQKIFQKDEKTFSDYLRSLQNVFRKHEERLSEIKADKYMEDVTIILKDLNRSGKLKKTNYQNYIIAVDKLFNFYISILDNFNIKSSSSHAKKDAFVHVTVSKDDKTVQTEIISENYLEKEIVKTEKFPFPKEKKLPSGLVLFELQFELASFTYFSEHLKRTTENNPKIFLTWNFMDDNEQQAYTPTISVSDGQFNCSCQYEGPWSKLLYNYLFKHGINVEIHLVQDDISVRLAESKIETSASVQKANVYHQFVLIFDNDNVKGNVTGTYMLVCDTNTLSLVE